MLVRRVDITTNDNPYDPIDDFSNWYMFDIEHGYYTSAYLARLSKTSEDLTDEENTIEIEKAIDTIIENDFSNLYKKIERMVEVKE